MTPSGETVISANKDKNKDSIKISHTITKAKTVPNGPGTEEEPQAHNRNTKIHIKNIVKVKITITIPLKTIPSKAIIEDSVMTEPAILEVSTQQALTISLNSSDKDKDKISDPCKMNYEPT